MIATRMRWRGLALSLLALATMSSVAAQGPGGAADGPTPPAPRPRAAPGFVLSEFAVGLERPVALLALPNGDLIVEEGPTVDRPGRAFILRDADRDGVAERRVPLRADLTAPAAWLLRRDRLYRADAAGLERCAFLVGQQAPVSACRVVADFGGPATDAPVALAMYPDESRLVVLNAKGVHSLLPDGGDLRPLGAETTRRAAALAVEPRLARPWVASGPEPADAGMAVTLQSLPAGGGPGAAVSIPAAGMPTALVFYRRRALPPELHGAALLALSAGSGEAALPAHVVAIPFTAGRPSGPSRELLLGRGAPGRFQPTAIAVLSNGAVVVADAASGTVWRLDFVP